MEENILITEGKFDNLLLQKVLSKNLLEKVKISEGMGQSSALSLARSFAAKGNNKILLVIDTDTFDENTIKEKFNYAESVLKMITSNSDVRIIQFVPEVDSLLFMDKTFIESFFDTKISDLEFSLYQRDPKFAYVQLSKGKSVKDVRQKILSEIDENVIKTIQSNSKIKDIENFFM